MSTLPYLKGYQPDPLKHHRSASASSSQGEADMAKEDKRATRTESGELPDEDLRAFLPSTGRHHQKIAMGLFLLFLFIVFAKATCSQTPTPRRHRAPHQKSPMEKGTQATSQVVPHAVIQKKEEEKPEEKKETLPKNEMKPRPNTSGKLNGPSSTSVPPDIPEIKPQTTKSHEAKKLTHLYFRCQKIDRSLDHSLRKLHGVPHRKGALKQLVTQFNPRKIRKNSLICFDASEQKILFKVWSGKNLAKGCLFFEKVSKKWELQK